MASQRFTFLGWSVCTWVLVVSFQYGFHISALNQLQAVLTCRVADPAHSDRSSYGLPTCIPMSDATFSVVTAVFTVGGLAGSLCSNLVMDRWGRKAAIRASALHTALGAGLMTVSASITPLLLGRFLVGVGAGIGICVGPIYLSEIAPESIKGNVGVLTQLGIVLGIMITQAMGLRLATPHQWRLVLLFSTALSVAQFFVSPFAVESPAWFDRKGRPDDRKTSARRLWGITGAATPLAHDVEDPLLEERRDEPRAAAVTVPQALKAPELRRPLLIVSLAMMAQQISGVNAVLYYSNDILSKSLPDLGPYVSLGITIVNVLMTFPPILLIERMGRKQLLQISVGGALLSLVGIGLGLNTGIVTLSSIAIMTFIMSFAVGLGPIPFVMIPEVSPPHAVSALSSVALSLNWIVNFIVGLVFLPLRNLLAGGDPYREGIVFYVFAVVLFITTFSLSRVYRG
ncbi:hypothetical protein PLICRDRAFT_40541 [Plicaturopsis crispa FD-325 SS-3]|nr:hypothetical protein PLICRDRAFT_40541 [Plicaturopsis crispa FD-325 SS-3]